MLRYYVCSSHRGPSGHMVNFILSLAPQGVIVSMPVRGSEMGPRMSDSG